jgi:hypothetical protein
MSLIPSESTSFSDLLGRGLDASKKSKWRVSAAPELGANEVAPRVAPAKSANSSEVRVRSSRSREKSRPVPSAATNGSNGAVAPNLAPLDEATQAAAPPASPPPAAEPIKEVERPPIPIVRIARSNGDRVNEGVDTKPAIPAVPEEKKISAPSSQSVLPPPRPPTAKPRLRPRPVLQPRFETVEPADSIPHDESIAPSVPEPASLVAPASGSWSHDHSLGREDETEQFGFPESTTLWPSVQRRRRARLIRFVVYELIALVALVLSAGVGLSHRLPNDPISLVTKVLTIASAIAVVVVPIIFYGLPETLPRSQR